MPGTDPVAPGAPPSVNGYPAPRDESKKMSFWISQLFILAATVLGVYLAANMGFKQAIAYGELQSARNNYFLRQSIRDEVVRNIPLVRAYMDGMASGPNARSQPIDLDTFVWDCMANSSQTLETPPELLSGSRAFYLDIAATHKLIAANTISANVGKERLSAALDHMEKNILPAFEADLQALKSHLKANNITVK